VWGTNYRSQRDVPALPLGWTFTHIAAGYDFTLALIASGGFNSFGEGCAGSGGVTALAAAALPQVGSVLHVDLTPPPPGPAVLLVGFSNTRTAVVPLPADLSPLGMPGCWLRVSPDLLVPVSGSPARATVPIPDDPTFAGTVFHAQALLLDAGVNPVGAVLSDAATAVVGR
jgi:hypothetical protein